MPTVPLLESEALKWQRRISMLQGAGLSTAPATELAKTDLKRIIAGGSALPEEEVVSMVHAAYTGQVTTPPATGGGPDWNPFHIAASIGKDVTTDVRSFMPGLVHEAADIINPSKWAQVAPDVGAALGDIGSLKIGDAAKQIQATPIIGPLVPATYAIAGGWKGFTDHPLNDFLSVLPLVSAGSKLLTLGADEAEAGTAMAALKQGHPIEAIARKTGLEDRFQTWLETSKGPIGQYAAKYQPVWTAYNALARIYARRFAQEGIKELKDAGLIGKALSAEESQRLVIDSMAYNTRYEQAPLPAPSPADVAAAGGDVTALLHNVPSGRDVTAYTLGSDPNFQGASGIVTADPVALQAEIFWSPQDAMNQAIQRFGEEMRPYLGEMIHEVRVTPGDVTYDPQLGYVAKGAVPNRTYKPGEGEQLLAIRKYSDKWQEKAQLPRKAVLPGQTDKPSLKVPLDNPITGKTEIYDRSSRVYRTFKKAELASKTVELFREKLAKAKDDVEEAQRVVEGKTATYAKYGESATDAAKRPPTLPSTQSLYAAAQDFIRQGMDGPNRKFFDKLDKAFATNKPQDIKTALARLGTMLRRRGPEAAAQEAYRDYLYHEAYALGTKSGSSETALADLARAKERYQGAMDDLDVRKNIAAKAEKAHYQALVKDAPDRFYPLIHEQARGALIRNATDDFFKSSQQLRNEVQGAGLAQGLAELHQAYTDLVTHLRIAGSREDLEKYVDPKTLARVEKNAFQDWVQMAKAGYNPIWMHELAYDHYDKMTFGEIRPFPTKIVEPKSARARIFDFSPQVLDVRAVLSAHAVDYLQTEATRQFVDFLINKSGIVHNMADITDELEKRFGVHAISHLKEDYVPFDPAKWVDSWKGKKADQYVIPRPVAKGLEQLMEGNRMPFRAVLDPLHRVFKVSVLTGPRHMVHIGVGGLVMTALRDPGAVIEMLAHAPAVFKLAKEGKVAEEIQNLRLDVPSQIWNEAAETVQKGMYEERVDNIMELRAGMKYGELWRQSKIRQGLVNTEQHINDAENLVTDFYRASVYLHEMRHGATNEAAMALVNKTLINVDALTPFEKTVIRQVFPFWTFTKHILQYVMTYPADHPFRASILANLAANMEDTNATGDPGRLSKLLMFGGTSPFGTKESVDISNLNPFRSMSSVFSMTGFLMGMAPEFQTALKALGINPATGTPSLHQNFTYDAYTGTTVATRPKLNIFDFASSFIPQVEILDHYLLFTDTMRKLKQSNPEAYQRAFWQELNLPFAVAPINIYDVRAKAAAGQFRDAQQAVSNALATGNTAGIRTFETVPFEGYLYPADQVANYIDNYDRLFPGIAPKAVQRKPKQRKRKIL